MEKISDKSTSETVSNALLEMKKKEEPKEGVSLLDITKKLSSKKFGKK